MNRFIPTLFLILCTLTISAQTRKGAVKPSQEYLTHLNAAKSHHIGLVKSTASLNKLISQGKLVNINQRGYGFRIARLTHSHSCLVPKGKTVLRDIARTFVQKTGQNFFVVTSLTRTLDDQNRLRKVNSNAASNDSSHSYGAAFDISYVRFNHKLRPDRKLENALETVLKEFKNAGKIYYVKEHYSRCFHIIVR